MAQSLICSPFLMSLNQSNIRKKKRNNPGNNPGYIKKESINLPSSKKEMDRWIPHPGQSIPVNCLLIQGSIQLSFMRSTVILVRNTNFYRFFISIDCGDLCNVNSVRKSRCAKTITTLCCSWFV